MGSLSITGATLDPNCAWRIATDALGWTHVVLVSDPEPDADAARALDRALTLTADPGWSVHHLLGELEAGSGPARPPTSIGLLRVSPCGSVVEVTNVSLGTVLHWDPSGGILPLEALTDTRLGADQPLLCERLTLAPGGALVLATEGILSRSADWGDLNRFVRRLGLEPVGGDLAEVAPTELRELLVRDCGVRPGRRPTGLVLAGLPRAAQAVA
ncbi:MAG: hypothetical protein ACFCGT_09105 [Sandaracinaceae bacterium]